MSREMLNDESLDKVVGGALSYRWRKATKGQVGVNGNYTHVFTDKAAFEAKVGECVAQGMTDVEMMDELIAAGIIWPA